MSGPVEGQAPTTVLEARCGTEQGPMLLFFKYFRRKIQRCYYFLKYFRRKIQRCYYFLNIFAEKYSEKIGVFGSKQS
jgi:hypothetical protein